MEIIRFFSWMPKGGNLRIRTLVCVCEIKTRAHSTHRIKFNQMTSVQSATLSENERLCSRFVIEINIYNIISVFQILLFIFLLLYFSTPITRYHLVCSSQNGF